MKRYLVERRFPHGLVVPMSAEGRQTCGSVATVNAPWAVTWLRSYVSSDGRKTWCLYEAPSQDAIRQVAERNGLPVERITEVALLSPHPFPFESLP
jgi:hypothetical protein